MGRTTPFLRRTLGLTRDSPYEDAALAGERFVAEYDLGEVPAERLAEVMERDLGILVLMVDACDGISGAACRLPELDTVLIARREVEGRRHLDLARELFHILTWDAMPPGHSEGRSEWGPSRVAKLANSFAAAVLMPTSSLGRSGDWRSLGEEALIGRLNRVAHDLRVTSSALRWRLVALDYLKRSVAKSLPDAALRYNGRNVASNTPPTPYSRPFVEVLALANAQGLISMRRVATLLDSTVEDFADLCEAHDIPVSIGL